MAGTITSTTGTVDGTDITYDVIGQGSARGDGVISYIDFTKDSDDISISFSYKNDETDDDNYYQEIEVDAGTLSATSIAITASGKYRIPISIASNEDSLKVSVSGLDTGSFNIEFTQDNGFR